VKAIASTGGLVGVRYIVNETSYDFLADEIDYMADLVGIEHIGVGWLGHDIGNPAPDFVPGFSEGRTFSGRESESMYTHWNKFIELLYKRNYSDNQIALILGDNYLRIWKEILPG
jgi:membrane dipeptidase